MLIGKINPSRVMETRPQQPAPWPQQIYDNPWLLAGAAIVFFVLSYIVWGVIDLLTIPTGGTTP